MKQIQTLEKQMLNHAKNMEFEQAAIIRDKVLAMNEAFKRG